MSHSTPVLNYLPRFRIQNLDKINYTLTPHPQSISDTFINIATEKLCLDWSIF